MKFAIFDVARCRMSATSLTFLLLQTMQIENRACYNNFLERQNNTKVNNYFISYEDVTYMCFVKTQAPTRGMLSVSVA